MKTLIILLSIVIIAFLIFFIWDRISIRRFIKHNIKEEHDLKDNNYYELKYKIEYLIATFSLILATAGFLGYNSIGTIKEDIRKEISFTKDSLDAAFLKHKHDLHHQDSVIQTISKQYNQFNKAIPQNKAQLSQLTNQSQTLASKIHTINSKNIIKQNYYIVSNLSITLTANSSRRIYFKNLKTSSGDFLPQFKKKPMIIMIPEGSGLVGKIEIVNVTTEYFDVTLGTILNYTDKEVDDNQIYNYSVMIIEKN